MPHNESTRVCNANEAVCYLNAEFNIMEKEIERQLEEDFDDESCDCLPVCNTLEYEADVTSIEFNFKGFLKTIKETEEQWKK